MKKSLVFVMVIAVICASLFTLTACDNNNKDNTEPAPGDFNASGLPSVSLPSDIPDYMLKIKWLDENGYETDSAFINNRPTVIVFHGASESYNTKFTTNLDSTVYGGDIQIGGSNVDFHPNLSYYWTRKNFNIGVFHYESFVSDTNANINAKIYNKSRMTYFNNDGNSVNGGLDFNLTEAFVSEWLKINASALDGSGVQSMMEVRFIGVHVGANLALSAAEYLEALYDSGKIGAERLPTRVDILNPYFSNIGDSTVVDFKEQTTLGSALTYNAGVIERLAACGVIMDMVESDKDYYKYADANGVIHNFTGIETVSENDVEVISEWKDEGDSGAYLKIKSKLAYLTFNESFSSKYPTGYVKSGYEGDVAVLHWFLYSIFGSDASTEVSWQDGTNTRAMLDGLNYKGVTTSTAVKYAVSAWTPTVYLRAVRGVEYEMKKYNSSSTDKPFTAWTMSNFQTESYQISNLTLDKMYTICGYIYYTDDDNSPFVELRRDRTMGGVTIEITASKSSTSTEPTYPTYKTTTVTESDGFYSYNIGKIKSQEDGAYVDMLGYTAAVKVQIPSNRYATLQSTNDKSSNFANVNRNSILAESGASTTMYQYDGTNFFVAIYNGGLLKKF